MIKSIHELKQHGWTIETEQLDQERWVARLRDADGYLQETGKGKTEPEALARLEKNYAAAQRFYK